MMHPSAPDDAGLNSWRVFPSRRPERLSEPALSEPALDPKSNAGLNSASHISIASRLAAMLFAAKEKNVTL